MVTKLAPHDTLPLTCTRTGTCCHGKAVWLNPWELASLANEMGLSPRQFRDTSCDFGGIRLRFDGPPGWKKLPACTLYNPHAGCRAHAGRPLACRLYPLGRQKQGDASSYIYQGEDFPCLEGCPEVVDLPTLRVADYLQGQGAQPFELVQDLYVELMQDLADGAFALLIESGLAATGDTKTLHSWRTMGRMAPQGLASQLGPLWLERLMLPALDFSLPATAFVQHHHALLQEESQKAFATLSTEKEFQKASTRMMGLALHLGRGLGAQPKELAEHWIATAKDLGAKI